MDGSDAQEAMLVELVRLARVRTFPVAREVLRGIFFLEDGRPDAKRVRVYASLDGSTQKAVATAAGVSQASVSTWSRDWQRSGLVTEDGRAVFRIVDFFPELKDVTDD